MGNRILSFNAWVLLQALDYILQALKLCDVDDLLCAKIHSDHGDILKDLGDLSSSAQVGALDVASFIRLMNIGVHTRK